MFLIGCGRRFPQWNCNCRNCAGLRAGTIRARARTQSSIAVSADGARWFVANASPDIRQQIEAFPGLHPRRGPRDTPIQAVILTNADIDHIAGLLSLRESQPLKIYATATTRGWVLGANAIFRVLNVVHGQVHWETIELGKKEFLTGVDERDNGLFYEAFAVPGKPPTYLGIHEGPEEATIGLRFIDGKSGRSVAYVPGVKAIDENMKATMEAADVVLFDGTFWSDDEMGVHGVGSKTARAMGHLPIGGPEGSLAATASMKLRRKVYIHINNTNPILDEDSSERREVEDAGWEIAFDGMDFEV